MINYSMVHTYYGNKIYANIKIYAYKWFLITWQMLKYKKFGTHFSKSMTIDLKLWKIMI